MFCGRALGLAITFSLVAGTATAAQTPVTVAGAPAAPLPSVDGTGLCIATKVWTEPVGSLPQTAGTFASGMNAFFEANPQNQTTSVHRAPFDLSNNLNDGRILSYGDFTGTACAQGGTGGCSFTINDAATTFGTRLRGFLRVAATSVGHPIHIGTYTDDAMSLTIFDGAGQAHAALVRPPQVGAPTWRLTNSVTFSSPGLYPIELLYAQITEHAALEVSIFDGEFSDFERAANQPPVVNLKSSGFALLDPKDLFQSEEATPSFPDLDRCQQCDRASAGQPGNAGCSAGYHCNAAALCSACGSTAFCGPSCAPCENGATCASVDGTFRCVAPIADAGTDGGQDAGSPVDGGTDAGPAAPDPDAGAADLPAPSTDDGGCGCHLAGRSAPSWFGLAGLVLGLGLIGRRHARRR